MDSLESVTIISLIIALLFLPSLIIMYKCIKKRGKFYIIIACTPILIAICFMFYYFPLLEKANINISIINEQKTNFKNFISDLKYYNEYIHDIDNYKVSGDCELYSNLHTHKIQIVYSEDLEEYNNSLVYAFSSLEQPDFAHYFNKYYNFSAFDGSISFNFLSYVYYYDYDAIHIECYIPTYEHSDITHNNKQHFEANIIESNILTHYTDNTIASDLLTYINEEQPKDINKMITAIENTNFEPVISYEYSRDADYRIYYIIAICLLSIVIALNIANIILAIVLKKLPEVNNVSLSTNNEIQQISDKSKQNQAEFTKPKWEDLSEENKRPYIETAIKELFEQQIKDSKLNLSRQEIALKKMALDNKEFLEEDLNEDERIQIINNAKLDYENNKQTTNKEIVPTNSSKLLKANPLNFFKLIFYSILQNKKEKTYNPRTQRYENSSSNRCKAIIQGEENHNLAAFFRVDGVVLMSMLYSYHLKKENIEKVALKSSNSKFSLYRVLTKCGHVITLQIIPEMESMLLRRVGEFLE